MNEVQIIKEIFPQVKTEKIVEEVWEAEARMEAYLVRLEEYRYSDHCCYVGYEGL